MIRPHRDTMMIIWYNPDSDEIRLQFPGLWLFETEKFPFGNLYFVPRRPWAKVGFL